MKKHSNVVSKEENDYSPETKVMKYCNLTEREFKIADMKKLNKLQEN